MTLNQQTVLVAVLVPNPDCKIGCNGTGVINRMHMKMYKESICACCAITFRSNDIDETMSALQDLIVRNLEDKDKGDKDGEVVSG